jgi:hypothetical protein
MFGQNSAESTSFELDPLFLHGKLQEHTKRTAEEFICPTVTCYMHTGLVMSRQTRSILQDGSEALHRETVQQLEESAKAMRLYPLKWKQPTKQEAN